MLRVRKLKSLLLVSCFGAHMASATDTEQSHVDIRVLQSDIETSSERVRRIREAYGDAPSVVFIGNIGRGKGSLITHLAGRTLIAQRSARGVTVRTNDPLPDIIISAGAIGSKVVAPWHDPASGVVYWDCPGFGDPRGSSQDIINAFSIQQLFQTPSRVKIVLVMKEEDFRDRVDFINLLDRIVDTFQDDDMLRSSISLVATRCRDIEPAALKDMYDDPDVCFKNHRAKILLKFLADNNATRFSFMPLPDLARGAAEGPYEGNRLGILASIEHAEYVINPIFRVALSPMSKTCVRILLDKLNSSVAAKLALSQDRVIEKIYDDITKFNGDSGGLCEQIRTHYDAIASLESLRSCRVQDREGVLHFAAIYGLEDATQQFIASSINQLHSLGLILGEASSPFSIDTWFGSLGRIRKELHDLSVVLAAPPIRITKTPLDESFTGPTSRGTVREEEKFKFPNGLKKVMIRDLSASRLLNYTNDDANLRAVPKEVYTIERPGRRTGGAGVSVNGVETLEGRTLEPVAYERRLMDAHVKEGTFDFGRRIVDLNVKRVYQRPDGTLYTKEERIDSVAVNIAALRGRSSVYECTATYEDKVVALPDLHLSLSYEHRDAELQSIPREIYTVEGLAWGGIKDRFEGRTLEPVAYKEEDPKIKEGEFSFEEEKISLKVSRHYRRPDETLYTKGKESVSTPVKVVALPNEVDPVSHVSREVYACSFTYRGVYKELPNHYGSSTFDYNGCLNGSGIAQLKEDFDRGDFAVARFHQGNALNRTVSFRGKEYNSLFHFWSKKICLNENLIELDLDRCFLGDIKPLIEVLHNVPNLEILKTHGVHDSDRVGSVCRDNTINLARTIRGLQRLHTLDFDMAHAASNLRSATAVMPGPSFGERGGFKIGKDWVRVKSEDAMVEHYPIRVGGSWVPSDTPGIDSDGGAAGGGSASAAATIFAAGAGVAVAANPVVGAVVVGSSLLGGLLGGAKDLVQGASGNSTDEALEIINNLAKARSLRTLNLWKVTSSVFDYDKDNFTKILKEKLPEISITFREDD